MVIKTLKAAKRAIVALFGFTIILLGLALSLPGIPGPGLLVILAGVALLAIEFVWARKLLKRFRDKGRQVRNRLYNRKSDDDLSAPDDA